MLGQWVPYARKDENVRAYFVKSMQQVIDISDNENLNDLVRQQMESILTFGLSVAYDSEQAEERAEKLLENQVD